jgi:two-component system response regulator PilR (NtrC family)
VHNYRLPVIIERPNVKARILIVDDETSMREFLSILLQREGYATVAADSAESALKVLAEQKFDLVISDVNMPGLDGIGLLEQIKSNTPDTVVMMITAFSTTEQAVEAMKHGAYNYIAKPFKVDEIKLLIRNAVEKQQLAQENAFLKGESVRHKSFSGMIGKSKKMLDLFQLLEKVASSNATVMISGESGTGKELAAKAIHLNSDRRDKPFVAINCGAIPETLMESEFFGHVKGAFTGAVGERPGLFEQASGGTLFLDEIGEVPLLLQAKLLRVIQEREVRRVGGAETRRVDVRIVTATNRDLEQQVAEGSFREDLFYRLNVVQVALPPLRERLEDIPLLVDFFLTKHTSGRVHSPQTVSPDALELLWGYQFPGNVRELENIIERAVALGAVEITPDTLPQQVIRCRKFQEQLSNIEIPPDGFDLERYLDDIEKKFFQKALEKSGGVKKRAAELLGLTFRSFRYKLAKHGMADEE